MEKRIMAGVQGVVIERTVIEKKVIEKKIIERKPLIRAQPDVVVNGRGRLPESGYAASGCNVNSRTRVGITASSSWV
ncbi:hypothetical protein [Dickeya dianthicola]|uniref:hypothetical protein n=1 Tax=Dickeya dianthicola TaxID=204039 RepID=UPI001D010A12|nr:hypothetical protein [Dickeya dianthicola]